MRDLGILRWRLAGLLLAVFVIVALPYAITRISSRDAARASAWVSHTSQVKAATYRVAYLTRDAESAAYRIVTDNLGPLTKERLDDALTSLPEQMERLRELTRDNADEQRLIGSLGTIVAGRDALLEQAVRRHEAGDKAASLSALSDASSLFKMRDLVHQIISNEDTLLAERRVEADKKARNNRIALTIGAIAQLLLLVVIVVVSERQIGQRLQAESRESEAVRRAGLIVQAVREPIVLLDAQLSTLLVNNAFAELYGVEEGTHHGPLTDLGEGAWRDEALLQRLSDVLLRDRELWDYELTQRTADGTDRRLLINARRLQDESGTSAVLMTISDITVRALIERQINDLNRQLEGKIEQISDVNRELEAFSYSVSHDLRAPLRHIGGFAGKLEKHLGERLDDRGHHYLEVIANSAQRMGQLIEDLLVFSRLGRGAMRMQPVDMQTLVEEARTLAESDTAGRHIVWKIDALPVVVGDENMLRMVWQNLLGNAVKYTGQRERAEIAVTYARAVNGDYEFTVADNGAGFDMQYAGKLFGVFQRLHRASEFQGNGIGLANVRRIVARHGGRAWAQGKLGEGAQFYFALPSSEAGSARSTGHTP